MEFRGFAKRRFDHGNRVKLFIFGPGYTAGAFARRFGERFETIAATTRRETAPANVSGSTRAHDFSGGSLDADALADISAATHILISIPPDAQGDPTLNAAAALIEQSRACEWIGYLSSVAVYGDHGGAWIDEDAALNAVSVRGRQRVAAEQAWLDLGARSGRPVHIHRLAGIYGPGRNALVNLREGKAKRLIKPGQVFNRIHVDDIAAIIDASISHNSGGIWNVADDEPGPPQDIVAFAADLLGVWPPPEIPFDPASLTPMAASFYADNKRVSNARMKEKLGVALRYPTYREGLRSLLATEQR